MLDINTLNNYRIGYEKYLSEKKKWEKRGKDIANIHANIFYQFSISLSDKAIISFDDEDNPTKVYIRIIDFEEDEIDNLIVDIKDFILDNYKDIITEKFTKEYENKMNIKKKNKEKREYDEYLRLKAKYERTIRDTF